MLQSVWKIVSLITQPPVECTIWSLSRTKISLFYSGLVATLINIIRLFIVITNGRVIRCIPSWRSCRIKTWNSQQRPILTTPGAGSHLSGMDKTWPVCIHLPKGGNGSIIPTLYQWIWRMDHTLPKGSHELHMQRPEWRMMEMQLVTVAMKACYRKWESMTDMLECTLTAWLQRNNIGMNVNLAHLQIRQYHPVWLQERLMLWCNMQKERGRDIRSHCHLFSLSSDSETEKKSVALSPGQQSITACVPRHRTVKNRTADISPWAGRWFKTRKFGGFCWGHTEFSTMWDAAWVGFLLFDKSQQTTEKRTLHFPASRTKTPI